MHHVDPQRTWTGPAPADITAWTLVQAGHVAGRLFTAALGEEGVTPIQFGVLLQLDLHPGMSNGELARAVLVTPQSVSELMTSLERLGLVEREIPQGRGRRVRATLTSAGRRTLQHCSTAVDKVEQSLGLTQQQSRQLNTLLHHIID